MAQEFHDDAVFKEDIKDFTDEGKFLATEVRKVMESVEGVKAECKKRAVCQTCPVAPNGQLPAGTAVNLPVTFPLTKRNLAAGGGIGIAIIGVVSAITQAILHHFGIL